LAIGAIGAVAPDGATDTATARLFMGTIRPQFTRQPQFMCIHPVSTPTRTTGLALDVIGRAFYVLISAALASVS
jgi:hypothetical protein